ncbi:hypothetical protein O181_029091 [Austropuccinia psidii MF-1]|uniref:CCHC-type domain-containing protein n=1 Tax=Austropuccinia psidii MF-1 TaxID=1389203 RepID=A0A9Q3CQF5_9BASI|nr:hypothetical protein [Austropuccinia psidii MF-1]
MSQKMVHMKILNKYGGKSEHALKSRCIESCSTEEYINAPEDLVKRTKSGRNCKKVGTKSTNKSFIKKGKPRQPFKHNTLNSNKQRKCHKCGFFGHLSNNCLKKVKITVIVETDDHNDKEEKSHSEKETEKSESSESD